jgi:predicted GIY-YIG superfamily endonuclease
MTERTALYRIWGDADLPLYIGISKDFGTRWKQHAKQQPWWGEMRRLTVEWYDSRPEAEAAEVTAIRAEKPKYNKTHATTVQCAGDDEIPELWVGDGDVLAQVERIINSGCRSHSLVVLLISALLEGYREIPTGRELQDLAERVHVSRSNAYRLRQFIRLGRIAA